MAAPAPTTSPVATSRDHGFHPIPVSRVVRETAEAVSIVLDIPAELREAFTYAAGQFCTFRVVVDGTPLFRCYSMSSSPGVDDEPQVTVKRVPGGAVSSWLVDNVRAGDELEMTLPAGVFVLEPGERELVAFAAGSGITPVFSLLKAALHQTDRRVRLLYANRDPESVIFRWQLDDLAAKHPGRLEVVHHFDIDAGFVDVDEIRAFAGSSVPTDAGCYLCGPTPFMDIVEQALVSVGTPPDQIHIERFTPPDEAAGPVSDDGATAEPRTCRVTIELDGTREAADHHPGTTILQTARQLGMSPPSSCESGSCATCIGRLLEGSVEMHVNNALTDDEVDEGFILTCQSVPTSPEVSVSYGYE